MRPTTLNHNSLSILETLMRRHDRGRFPPTVRELGGEEMHINGVVHHLERLERLGLIRRDPREARAIVPLCRFIPANLLDACQPSA